MYDGQCGGDGATRQSPINIVTKDTEFVENLPDFDIISGNDTNRKMELLNNGHTGRYL